MSMPEQFPISDPFESGECAGCGVLLDDARFSPGSMRSVIQAGTAAWVQVPVGRMP